MKEVILGALLPALVAGISWIVTDRVYRRDPAALTAWMITAFVAKLVIFAVYVVLAVKVLAVRPAPFVTTLVSAFLVLNLAEAIGLKRLFSGKST
jgi:hypothetical protein